MDKVLVVDDNSVLRHLIAEYLTTCADFDLVGEAGNGREAISLVDKLRPDLVLMDVMMPVMNGVEATRVIKERWPQVVVITYSGMMEEEIIPQVKRAGASLHLTKPIDFDLLVEKAKHLLAVERKSVS